MSDARVVGAVLLALGGVVLWEGVRLVDLRSEMLAGAVVGDDTFPLLVGGALVLLGAYLALAPRVPVVRPRFPDPPTRRRMLWSAATLAGYAVAVPYLGYTPSTALVAVALFRGMGAYAWPVAALLGGGLTLALYLLFRVWLRQPLPTGLLGI